MTDEALRDVATDRQAQVLLGGDWDQERFSPRGSGGCGGLEPHGMLWVNRVKKHNKKFDKMYEYTFELSTYVHM